jgi:hypothetical protein
MGAAAVEFLDVDQQQIIGEGRSSVTAAKAIRQKNDWQKNGEEDRMTEKWLTET